MPPQRNLQAFPQLQPVPRYHHRRTHTRTVTKTQIGIAHPQSLQCAPILRCAGGFSFDGYLCHHRYRWLATGGQHAVAEPQTTEPQCQRGHAEIILRHSVKTIGRLFGTEAKRSRGNHTLPQCHLPCTRPPSAAHTFRYESARYNAPDASAILKIRRAQHLIPPNTPSVA